MKNHFPPREVIFCLAKKSKCLRVSVNSTEHWGTVRNGKWNYQESGMGTVKINSSLVTGGYISVIHIQENADVRLDGVTAAGNTYTDVLIFIE